MYGTIHKYEENKNKIKDRLITAARTTTTTTTTTTAK